MSSSPRRGRGSRSRSVSRSVSRSASRKRHPSSEPVDFELKKHRTDDSESNLTDSDTESPLAGEFKTPLNKPKKAAMASKMSDDDLTRLCDAISAKLKVELKSIISDEIKHQLSPLSTEIAQLKHENQTLKSEYDALLKSVDDLDQYGRRMCLDVSGIPGDYGIVTEDVESKLLTAFNTNPDAPLVCASDIDRCHRKGKFTTGVNRKCIVKFTNSKARDRVYSARKTFGPGVYVMENITRRREHLAYEARRLTRDPDRKLSQTWIAGGQIHAKIVGSDHKWKIRDLDDIERLRAGLTPKPPKEL